MTLDRRRRTVLAALGAAAALVAGGLTVATLMRPDAPRSEAPVAAPSTAPATVVIKPAQNATHVDPLDAVRVTATDGRLTGVEMVNEQNKPVPGVMTPDSLTWKPAVPLGYGRTYTLTVASRGQGGTPASQVSTFTTLTPGNQTNVSLTTTSGAALREGGTYGIGIVLVAHFDEPIVDRVAAERRLVVTSNPKVQGSWYWVDDQNAHWRPRHYFQPGTKITAAANIYGADLGDGLYGTSRPARVVHHR